MLNPSPEREREGERGREGEGGREREGERGRERRGKERGGERGREGERGKERERGGEGEFRNTNAFTHTYTTSRHVHTHILYYCIPYYYYVLYTHPERDQCYNESRQSVPDASSGPGQ